MTRTDPDHAVLLAELQGAAMMINQLEGGIVFS
jgi:hypothetical protein